LFIKSSKVSLKAVLLNNGNKFPSVSLPHAANMKKTYENMKLLLEKIQYEKYNWNICGDLKVATVLSRVNVSRCDFPQATENTDAVIN
jgi:hypothetical protein